MAKKQKKELQNNKAEKILQEVLLAFLYYHERTMENDLAGSFLYRLYKRLQKKFEPLRDIKATRAESEILIYFQDFMDGFLTASQVQELIKMTIKEGRSFMEEERKIIDYNLEEDL